MDKNKSWILKRKKNVLHGLRILKKKYGFGMVNVEQHERKKIYKNSSKLSTKRWIKFQNSLIGFKPKFEHIKGKDNILADWLSRQIINNVNNIND